MTRAPLSVTAEKPDQPYLSFNNVGQVFNTQRGPFEALKEINLEVAQGEFVCVIGHSGCGKSTLLNMVSGFLRPSSGSVTLRDVPIERPGPDRMVVFQNYSLLPWKTVEQNVDLARCLRPRPNRGPSPGDGGLDRSAPQTACTDFGRNAAAGGYCPGPGGAAGSAGAR
jgi:ABC-type sugar transport system ATPase subunit